MNSLVLLENSEINSLTLILEISKKTRKSIFELVPRLQIVFVVCFEFCIIFYHLFLIYYIVFYFLIKTHLKAEP